MDPLKIKLHDLSGGKILDVATGHGQFLRLLVEAFADFTEAIGIDTSENNIEIARRECRDGLLMEIMDARDLDYPDGYFDTVAIRHSLHHLADVDAVTSEMKRVLKPGGLFIVCEVFQSLDNERENSQRHLHHWWAAVDRSQGITHYVTFTKSEILQITDRLDLTDTDIFEYIEEYGDDKHQEILGQMIGRCKDIIKMLRAGNGSEELIRQGEDLVTTFSRLGFINESALYVLGRKALF
ncbi:MAG: class I SAM-dependent methyltransferase [candidate division Zixibacteria bacterium]|nr:class I SAM-dependent methyltransferase [candidate division Zixibacteria bacterium]MDD5427426.1 class I SAM-dependent methyltransferase [candidate division Zixibacteria bacterium]